MVERCYSEKPEGYLVNGRHVNRTLEGHTERPITVWEYGLV